MVVSPLTSEAILGLDFFPEQQATIDLAAKRLCLRGGGKDIRLREPTPRQYRSEISVRMVKTVEVPPRSEMEIMACLDTTVEGSGC